MIGGLVESAGMTGLRVALELRGVTGAARLGTRETGLCGKP